MIRIIQGDALALPIEDNTVDLVVTSPPYWGLRSYTDAGEHYDGQIGSEPTPAEFVDALIECTREWVRVLKPSGSIWVNLGDKYNAYNGNRGEGTIQGNGVRQNVPKGSGLDVKTVRPKSLIGLPWRYALRCIDDLGLILRAEVIWSKPNGLPESVTDRVRRSHEQWFHFTLNPRYYSAVDEVREAHAEPDRARTRGHEKPSAKQSLARAEGVAKGSFAGTPLTGWSEGERSYNPLGKLPGSVWTIATEPLRVPDHLGIDHFAAFPTEFPRRIIQGWSPREVCTACGEGRRPVSERSGVVYQRSKPNLRTAASLPEGDHGWSPAVSSLGKALETRITGYSCACPDTSAPTTPGVVLDPFGGTGTTALVASVLGRHGISVDLSADYCRLAEWRTSDPAQRARAARVKPAPVVPDGQLDLFSELMADE